MSDREICRAFAYTVLVLLLLVGSGCKDRNDADTQARSDEAPAHAHRQPPREAKNATDENASEARRSPVENAEFEEVVRAQPEWCTQVDSAYTSYPESDYASTVLNLKGPWGHLQFDVTSLAERLGDELSPGEARYILVATSNTSFDSGLRHQNSCGRLFLQSLDPMRPCDELFWGGARRGENAISVFVTRDGHQVWSRTAAVKRSPEPEGPSDEATEGEAVTVKAGYLYDGRGRSANLSSVIEPSVGEWTRTQFEYPGYEGVLQFNCDVRPGGGFCGYPEGADPHADSLATRFAYRIERRTLHLQFIESFRANIGACNAWRSASKAVQSTPRLPFQEAR